MKIKTSLHHLVSSKLPVAESGASSASTQRKAGRQMSNLANTVLTGTEMLRKAGSFRKTPLASPKFPDKEDHSTRPLLQEKMPGFKRTPSEKIPKKLTSEPPPGIPKPEAIKPGVSK